MKLGDGLIYRGKVFGILLYPFSIERVAVFIVKSHAVLYYQDDNYI